MHVNAVIMQPSKGYDIYIYLYNLQYVCFTSRLLLASDASIPFDDILGLLFFRGIDLTGNARVDLRECLMGFEYGYIATCGCSCYCSA